jgi:MarR-like DNA-binding transcriptional regulator SgrR of sgrS sRNA
MGMKRALIVFIAIGILIAGGFWIWGDKVNGLKNQSSDLRVAFPYDKPARFYEPTRIHLAPEYIFLENTFSPLVELSPKDAAIKPGIAESWSWDGSELRLKIRDGLKTVDGHEITAKDAEFSLKRLLVKTGNTHGNFQSLVCGAADLKSVDDKCEGIRVEGNELILKVKEKSAFILPMLTGIDFAVIPRRSVDPKTLDIVDYRNTSGPYYVSRDDEHGHIELSMNKNHYHASPTIPQHITLVPVDRTDKTASLKLFREGKVDFITTIDAARPEEVIALSREVDGSVLHTTANIRSIVLIFTERGLKELTQDQRLAIGNKVRAALIPYFKALPGYETENQYFPSYGEGAISDETAKSIAELAASKHAAINEPLKLTTVRVGDVSVFRSLLKKELPTIQVEEGKNVPAFTKYEHEEDMPQMFIGGPDTGYSEDISLISYSLVSGVFGMTPKERAEWLANYMEEPDKGKRLELLRGLHESSLRNGILVPILSCPYTALAQGGWKIGLSQLFANNPLWLIKRL